MRLQTVGLFIAAAALCASCGPQPGSPEWCKDVIQGKIQPTEADSTAHGQKCAAVIMQEMLGSMTPPGQ